MLGMLLLLCQMPAWSSARAATPTQVRVSKVELSQRGTVSGSELVVLDVSLHIDAPKPLTVSTWIDGEVEPLLSAPCPCVVLRNTTPLAHPTSGVAFFAAALRLVSGDRTSGTWQARVTLSSAQGGRWRVDGIGAPFDGPGTGATLVRAPSSPVVSFRGADWLTVTMRRSPAALSAGSPVTISGVAAYERGTVPARNLRLLVGEDYECASAARRAVRTDSHGRFSFAVRPLKPVPSTVVAWALPVNGRSVQGTCTILEDLPRA